MSVARVRDTGAASQSVGGSISIVTCINLGRVYEMETMKLTINSEKKKKRTGFAASPRMKNGNRFSLKELYRVTLPHWPSEWPLPKTPCSYWCRLLYTHTGQWNITNERWMTCYFRHSNNWTIYAISGIDPFILYSVSTSFHGHTVADGWSGGVPLAIILTFHNTRRDRLRLAWHVIPAGASEGYHHVVCENWTHHLAVCKGLRQRLAGNNCSNRRCKFDMSCRKCVNLLKGDKNQGFTTRLFPGLTALSSVCFLSKHYLIERDHRIDKTLIP